MMPAAIRSQVDQMIDRQDAIARAAAGELMGPEEIQAIFCIRKSRYYQLIAEGAFDQFRVHPVIGPKPFSGKLITMWLAGTPVYGTKSKSKSKRR